MNIEEQDIYEESEFDGGMPWDLLCSVVQYPWVLYRLRREMPEYIAWDTQVRNEGSDYQINTLCIKLYDDDLQELLSFTVHDVSGAVDVPIYNSYYTTRNGAYGFDIILLKHHTSAWLRRTLFKDYTNSGLRYISLDEVNGRLDGRWVPDDLSPEELRKQKAVMELLIHDCINNKIMKGDYYNISNPDAVQSGLELLDRI